jgi:OPT family oligopeptide transporter
MATIVDQPADSRKLEITWQSVVGAIVISALVSFSYPYVVLKLGMGPNVSVVSAFLGAIFLNVAAAKTRGRNRLMNNIIQTAGTSASGTAFMCVVAAAFGFLDMNKSVDVHIHITPLQMFLWLTCSGMIGVVFTVLFRKHFLDDPRMLFADGVAAAETINVLDAGDEQTRRKMKALGFGTLASGLLTFVRDGLHLAPELWIRKPFTLGIAWNLLSVGSGLLVGLNMGIATLLGTLVTSYIVGPWLVKSGIAEGIVFTQIAPQFIEPCRALAGAAAPTAEQTRFIAENCGALAQYNAHSYFKIVLMWTMWPATALMVSSALTAVALRWRSIVDTFRHLQVDRSGSSEDLSMKTVFLLAGGLTVALAVIQHISFGMSYLQTVVAVLASLPLMLVGIRVLGETNQGPVSAMANALQAVFAIFWPKSVGFNLIASGVAGNTSAQSEGTMQDYKTGRILGSTPRILTWVQLAAVPMGALAVAVMYPILVRSYGLGEGLSAPTGIKLANMAVLLSKGAEALPPYALQASIWAALAGIVIAVLKDRGKILWFPSVAGFGFAMILPGVLNIPIAIGGIGGWVWQKISPTTHEKYLLTVASGFIAGDALLAGLILPPLLAAGILK